MKRLEEGFNKTKIHDQRPQGSKGSQSTICISEIVCKQEGPGEVSSPAQPTTGPAGQQQYHQQQQQQQQQDPKNDSTREGQADPEVIDLTEDDILPPTPTPGQECTPTASVRTATQGPAGASLVMPVHTSLQQVPVQRRSLSEEEQVIAAVAAQGIPAYVARATIIELRESGQPISPAIVVARIRSGRPQQQEPAAAASTPRRKRKQPSGSAGNAIQPARTAPPAACAAASTSAVQQAVGHEDWQQYTATQAAAWQAAHALASAVGSGAAGAAAAAQGAQFDPMALMPIIAGLASPAGGSSGAGGSGRAPQGAREAGPIQLTFSLGQLNIHIGTSGYDFEWWRRDGGFYPPRCSPEKEFVIYSESFNTIELNATFYRKFPDSTTWDNWRTRADRVRPSFTYVIKCNKFFTHHKNLKVDGAFMERWQRFWGNCKRLGSHLGPLLFQFPASFATSLKSDGHGARTNLARLEKLAEVLERGHKFAFEFRHPSWYCEDVYALCRAHDWAFVTMDLRNCHKDNASGMVFDSDWMGEMTDGTHPAPGSLPSCASWGEYVRFHGADGKYTGAYGEREMQRWAMRAQQWAQAGKAAFFMFNNTDDYNGPVPSAIADSRTLARCLWPRVGSVAQHA